MATERAVEQRGLSLLRSWAAYVSVSLPLVWCAAGLLGFLDLGMLIHAIKGNPYWRTSIDFGLYLKAAHALARGANPYAFHPGHGPLFYGVPAPDPYAYPPLLAEVLWPLTMLGDAITRYAWLLVDIVCLVLSFALPLRAFGVKVPWPWIFLLVACFGATFTARNELYHGQVNPVLMLLFVSGAYLYWRRRHMGAGITWGLMLAIKPFLGIVVLYLIWKRSWRAAASTIAAGCTFIGLSFVPTLRTGLTTWRGWFAVSRYYSSSARPDNHALHALFLRLFTINPFTIAWVVNVRLAQGFDLALIVLLVAVFIATVRRPILENGPVSGPLLLVELSLVLTLGMVYGPLTEGDHIFVLIPGLLAIVLFARQRFVAQTADRRAWLWTAAVWTLVFALRLSPVRTPLIGLGSYDSWHRVGGFAVLLTGQVGMELFFAALMLAWALTRMRVAEHARTDRSSTRLSLLSTG